MLNPRESLVEDVEVQNLRMRLALLKVMVCVPNGQSCEESKLSATCKYFLGTPTWQIQV